VTIEELLGRCLDPGDDASTLTLDPAFQGLPDTAHGGSVLAVFDRIARVEGPREVLGVHHRRVSLGRPLALEAQRADGAVRVRLRDERTTLVDGHVVPGDAPGFEPVAATSTGLALPVSYTCFACGIENEIGLRVALVFDERSVRGAYAPREQFRCADGTVSPVVLTTLLDETAFWLGALATGESGMTTEIRVRLHRPAPFGSRLVVSGARARVAPRADDPRYWRTETAVHDEQGRLIASGRITFVAIRGAAKRLVAGMLAMNPPEVVHRVFPAHA
jgi:acyl-coenzyme A thioesterase PaaI-like protein